MKAIIMKPEIKPEAVRPRKNSRPNLSAGRSGAEAHCPGFEKHPRGSILMFTLVILLLVGLMGFAININTRTELNISGNTVGGRTAFTRADTAADVTALMLRAMLYPELDSPLEFFANSKDDITVIFNEDDFNLGELRSAAFDGQTTEKYQERYVRAGRSESDGDGTPDVIFMRNGKVLSTASIAMSMGSVVPAGSSLGGDVLVVMVTSVNGRSTQGENDSAAYDGADVSDAPHSVITIISREPIKGNGQ
ncbi:hypothetical protein C4J81_00750 [Deltaproteobacteria bacterium Smac51]|nr:hypothetical protein C4J81_00750 [Deltaproteobacteria bacterium Smac51]